MKLRFLLIMILLISIFLISCSVCMDDPVVPTSPTLTQEQQTIHNDEPPKVLYFSSIDDLEELRNTLEQSDKSLVAYLEKKRFHENGISNRSETEAFFKLIDTVPIFDLTANGLALTTLYYYYDEMVLEVFYRGENDGMRFRYLLNTDPDKKDIVISEEITKNYSIGGYKLDMYPNTKNTSVYTAYGVIDTGTYYIRVAYRNDKTIYPHFLENENIATNTLKELGKASM